MNYEEYLKAVGSNNVVWMRGENKVGLRFPCVNGNQCFDLNLSKTDKPVLVTGDAKNARLVMEATLLREYHPSLLRITEICTDESQQSASPLFDRTLNMRRYVAGREDIEFLAAYLLAVMCDVSNITSSQNVGHDIHNVIIINNIIGDVVTKVGTSASKTNVVEMLKRLCALTAEHGVTVMLFEETLMNWAELKEILPEFIGICFKSDAATSTLNLGTDIGVTLGSDLVFYTKSNDGDFIKCEIPDLDSEEIDEILTRVICSR